MSDLREQATWHRCPEGKHGDHGPQCVLAIGHGQRDEPHLWSDATEEIAEHIHKLQVSYNAANAMAGVGRRHLERLWETRERAKQAERTIARVRQMADAWEQRLPEQILTATAVEALRTATERYPRSEGT